VRSEVEMNRTLLLSLLALSLLFVSGCDAEVEVEGDEAGECDDGVDNDQDGALDCDDDGCAIAAVCAGDDDDTAGDDDDSAGDDDDSTPTGTDDDGDGVTVEDGDCNDSDATIYPGAPEVWGDGIDQDCDGVADVAGASCTASFTVDFPDGSSTTLDGCVDWSLNAAFEYDPDDPPEVRSFTLNFGATNEAAFECAVVVTQTQVCGTGYYDMAPSTGTTTYAIMDCSGVADEFEANYTVSTGYMRLDVLDSGSTAGNFTDQPLATAVEGYLSVDDGTGVHLSGSFTVSLEQITTDEEEQTTCAVSDGDEDDDGDVSDYYDGGDCDDNDPLNFGGNPEVCDGQDNDCDGAVDDDDPTATIVAEDGDCDGTRTADDCDDTDPDSTIVIEDGDCDGVLDTADCNPVRAEGTYASFETGLSCPVSYWDMETASAFNTVDDLIGNLNLDIVGFPTPVLGVQGAAYDIDDCGEYFLSPGTLGIPSGLWGSNPKSISVWAQLGTTVYGDGVSPFVSFGGGGGPPGGCGGDSFGVSVNQEWDAPMINTCGVSFDLALTSPAVVLDTWYHVVGTYDGFTLALWLDSVQVGNDGEYLNTATGFNRVGVGVDTWWSATTHYLCDGRIDEVKLYDYALTPAQVAELFAL
jgi:hypothetical protein